MNERLTAKQLAAMRDELDAALSGLSSAECWSAGLRIFDTMADHIAAIEGELADVTAVLHSVIENWPYDITPGSPYWNLVSCAGYPDAATRAEEGE